MGLNAKPAASLHLSIVAVLSLLWNLFGCYNYLMSKLSRETSCVGGSMRATSAAYMAGFPAWLTAFWALGVWGSLAGLLLLPPESPPLVITRVIWGLLVFLVYARSMAG
jgi:hypothetical protein